MFVRPFDLIRRSPSLFMAELAWRWSFTLGSAAVLMFVARRVSVAANLVGMIESGDGATAMERAQIAVNALAIALSEMGGTLLLASFAIALLWLVSATIGRGVIIRSVVRQVARDADTEIAPRFSWSAMAGAHFGRVFTLIVLVIGYLLAAMAENRILRADVALAADPASMPEPGTLLAMVLAFCAIMGLALVCWSLVHFVASMAPIFVSRDGRSTLDALADSVAFVRRRWRTLLSEATQNATLRTVIALAISLVAIAAGAMLMRPAPVLAVTIVAALTFAYVVFSDWLLLARTVAYVQIAEEERMKHKVIEATEKPIS
jgi:hypothetical protein